MPFDCPICFENLESSPGGRPEPCGKMIIATECGHLFHSHCLDEWLKKVPRARNCPSCRAVLKRINEVHVVPDKEPKVPKVKKAPESSGIPIVPKESKPTTPCDKFKCRELRLQNFTMMTDHKKLQDRLIADPPEFEILLLKTKRQSLMDASDKLINTQHTQAERIRTLLHRKECQCVTQKETKAKSSRRLYGITCVITPAANTIMRKSFVCSNNENSDDSDMDQDEDDLSLSEDDCQSSSNEVEDGDEDEDF